jgi:alpha,alpha-trehalase|tara:strand:- start:74 stop:1567 length:1494 start_codon:yes stop_codon:yes gene_type:complete
MALPISPEDIFEELFVDLHASKLWEDGKMLSDAIPLAESKEILFQYRVEKRKNDFDLKSFFEKNFQPNPSRTSEFKSDTSRPVLEHINILWDVLKREKDTSIEGSSLIPLPFPYIVPGGRFNEIYYWDSYFTMLGLQVSRKIEIIQNMVDNFSHLIKTVGFIPNGNRSYFLGRSQPPFYSLMIDMLAEEKGELIYIKYLPFLEKEYAFWMDGKSYLQDEQTTFKHVVLLKEGVLNRYQDKYNKPRAEMYQTDVELYKKSSKNSKTLYSHLRAACESGWDFSSRWMKDSNDLTSIHTGDILPIDLNCLLYHLELTLAKAYKLNQSENMASLYEKKAFQRNALIQNYFWNSNTQFYHDYDHVDKKQKSNFTLAAMFILFFNLATKEQAEACAFRIENEFLRDGGVITTTLITGQQWDAPNGWAPLQWITIKGLQNYKFDKLSQTISDRWSKLNYDVYNRTGKLLEKYNVEDISLLSGGGEYEVQDGFGWTNGVLLKINQ